MNSVKLSKPPSTRKKTILQRIWFWLLMIFILTAGGAGWYFLAGPGSQIRGMGAANLTGMQSQTTTVQRGDMMLYAAGSGTLVAGDSVDLIFSTSGTVTSLNVALGDYVEAGDELARMGNSITLEANLAKAELQLLQARQAVEDLQKNADLALAQAHQAWILAQQDYDDALESSERMNLSRCSQDVATRYKSTLDRAAEKLDQVSATVETKNSDVWVDARNDYETALANYNYCVSYTSSEAAIAQSTLDLAQVKLAQAEDDYSTLKENAGVDPDTQERLELSLTNAEAQLADAQEKLEGLGLSAPISGKVVYLAASQGEVVGTSVFITVADVAHPQLEVSVDESDLDKMVVGSPVTVTFDALPDQEYHGTLIEVNPRMVSSGMYQVVQGVVELDAEAARMTQKLPLGLSAGVNIISQQVSETLIIPLTALQKLANGEYAVNIVDQGGNLSQRMVTVGILDATQAEITAGLEEGEILSTMLTKYSLAGTGSNDATQNIIMPEGGPPGGMPMP